MLSMCSSSKCIKHIRVLGKDQQPHVNCKYCLSKLTEKSSRAVRAGQQGH